MEFRHRRQFLRLAAGVVALPAVSRVASAQAYPARPVRMIVPLTAGSAADILARQIATKMSESWGQPVVVENRPGAGTTMGTDVVAKAAPDGHTLLINSAAYAASAAIYTKLPYDPIKDLIPISQIATAPIIVVAAPSLGARSIKDLVELGKRRPGEFSFGSAGVGSSTHFAGEQFKLAAGLNAVHVPYKGPAEALLDTMTGRIQYSLSPILPAMPFVTEGKLLALAVTTAQRSPMLQQVPTIAETGLPGFDYQDWWGAFAPAGTPPVVVDKISKEIVRVLQFADIQNQLLTQGAEARPTLPAEFANFVRTKIDAARQVAASASIRVN
jgi:tripartite-type tricarboxylate transporter receptor subunit TctC